MDTVIENAIAYIKTLFSGDFSGHDPAHTMRVYRMALRLAETERADRKITALAALLHDADDFKLSPSTYADKANAVSFLRAQGADEALIEAVVRIIGEVSFKGTDSVVPSTIEGKCVQDADRLDAIGAIGIGRAFAYGGAHARAMHDPAIPPLMDADEAQYRASQSTTINHFYEKLLLLKDRMNTDAAKEIAARRDAVVRGFLDEFLLEWDGER